MIYGNPEQYVIGMGGVYVYVDVILYDLFHACGLIGREILLQKLAPFFGNSSSTPAQIEKVFPNYQESEWYQTRWKRSGGGDAIHTIRGGEKEYVQDANAPEESGRT